MTRSNRLLALIQLLREHRHPVSAETLAERLGVSVRTVYRDVGSLREQGAQLEGEPGMGYVLRPGFLLPPLMFHEEELEALVLGSRWVIERGDPQLAAAARSALARIAAVLPADLRTGLEEHALLVGPGEHRGEGDDHLPALRSAIREQRKVRIAYDDGNGQRTSRVIWPLAVGFFDRHRVIAAWCELRQDHRHFRADRIAEVEVLADKLPRRRAALVREWRLATGIAVGEAS